MKINTALSTINYANLLSEAIDINNALSSPTPYVFTPLLTASKGVPLTADDFNALVNALEQVYSLVNQPLPYAISPAFGNEIVHSETFKKIVDNLNTLRHSALQSVLLTSETGAELNSLSTNFAGQNVLVCSASVPITLSGAITIENLLIVTVPQTFIIKGYTTISKLIIQSVSGAVEFADTANASNVMIGTLYTTVKITGFSSIQNLFINSISPGGQLIIRGNAYVENLEVNNCNPNSIILESYAIVVNTLGKASQCIASS